MRILESVCMLVLCSGMCALLASCHDRNSSPRVMLFLGDSITEEGYFVTEIEEALKRESSGRAPRVINRGKNSETISGLSEKSLPIVRPCLFDRLDKELERAKPDWVVVCYGLNCGLFQPFTPENFQAYKDGMERLVAMMQSTGRRLIILTPPPYAKEGPGVPDASNREARVQFFAAANDRALKDLVNDPRVYGYRKEYPYYNHVMEVYSDWLKTLDARTNVWVVDVRGAMMASLNDCFDTDSIHPNQYGHHVIADAFLREWPRIRREAYSSVTAGKRAE